MPRNATGGAIPADNKWERLARRYLRFAREAARDACPIYAALAEAVASSPDLLAFQTELPEDKRQPNLFLAAVQPSRACRATARTSPKSFSAGGSLCAR